MNLLNYIRSTSSSILCQLSLILIANAVLLSSTSLDKSLADILYLDILFLAVFVLFFLHGFIRTKNNYGKVFKALKEKRNFDYLLPEDESFYSRLLRDTVQHKNAENTELVSSYKNSMDELNDYILKWVHEIKIPISVLELILENTELTVSEDSRKFKVEIERIKFLANQVLYAGKVYHYQESLVISEFKLQKAVREALKINSHFLMSKNMEVITGNLDFDVLCDEKWVVYILEQLLNNAGKYSRKDGKVEIHGKEDEKAIRLHVRDNGIGIPATDIGRIFDKGFTGENGRKTPKSTGMGLYYAKKIAGRLGIDLEVSSEEGGFTEFVLTFYKLSDYLNVTKT